MYPYIAGGTGLTACFPPWAAADGKLFDNLADAAIRARIRAEIENQTEEWENLCMLSTPDNVLILGLGEDANTQYVGKRLNEIAASQGKDWIETAFDLVLSERQRVGTIYFMMEESNVRLQLRQPWMKFGTDAGGPDPATARGLTHPRAYGTFTRILGKYVRDEQVIPLEDAVRKMTSANTAKVGIHDRGLLRPGQWADLAVFDPARVSDHATFEKPHQYATGVEYVVVNGQVVLDGGRATGARPGVILYGPGKR
jgi:dihydroorotase/N-acyl-D-amino-acid deacylase